MRGGFVLGGSREPMATVGHVDVERFMGTWRVISHIPTPIERKAYDAVERYELREDGKIATTFTFRKGGFDGPRKEYRPVGWVHDRRTNAEWRMRFVWPFSAEYLIIHLSEDYGETVVARTKRDYAWIMSRSATMAPERHEALVGLLAERGYDTGKVRMVPQREGA